MMDQLKAERNKNTSFPFRINRAFSRSFVQRRGKRKSNQERERERERERNVGETLSRVLSNVLRPSVSGQTFDHLDIWKR